MKYVFTILILGLIGFIIGKFIKHKSLYPFMPYRYDFRKRRNTFLKVLELLDQINAKVLIETGTSREGLKGAKTQGAATIVFGKWAKLNQAVLHSVDINEESIRVAQAEVDSRKLNNNVKIHLSDSCDFLLNFKESVDFLYLDSYDYSDQLSEQIKSQVHHLNEFKYIENRLHKNSIVMIDDCDLPGGGKGKLVIEYMLARDWRILMMEYQVLLLHKDSLIFSKYSE